MDAIALKSETHPFQPKQLDQVRELLAPRSKWGVEEGQPFHLDILTHLAEILGDADSAFPQLLKPGVPLGVG